MNPVKQKYRSILGVESLEKRMMMDGDVGATFSGGDLTLTGDEDDNQVIISRLNATKIRVTGLEETMINGKEFVDFTGKIDDIRVFMQQGGEDQIAIRGPIKIVDDVFARLGDGEFIVEGTSGAVEIGGDLNVRAFGELGEVKLRNHVIVKGDATLRSGGSVTAAANRGFIPNFSAAKFSDPLNIDNPYFPLVLGTVWTYQEKTVDEETGEPITETIVVEVTNKTKTILGVKTRVIRDRVYENGVLIEDTFDWHAQDDNGNVWYFGEDTTSFEYDDEGNVIEESTAGSFEAGVDGARAGIVMLAKPTVGARYYQEVVPGEALDQGEVLRTNDSTKMKLGSFKNLVRTKDTTVMEPDGLEHKLYAPGIGFIREFKFDVTIGERIVDLQLISLKLNGKSVKQVVSPTGFTGTNVTGNLRGNVEIHGDTSIIAKEMITILDATFADDVHINGKSDVAILDSTFRDDLWMRTGSGDAGLTNTRVDGPTFIGSDGDVYLFKSVFKDEVRIRFGWGDNTLVVKGSTLEELDADGSRGDNEFDDQGGNSIEDLVLTRFDEA